MMRINYRVLGLMVMILTTLFSSCSKFLYDVTAVNYGELGVIFLKMPTARINVYRRTNPGIPGVRDDISHFGQFHDHPNSLPDQVVVEWQLAELSNCKRIIKHKSFVYKTKDEKIYTRKAGCTWTPVKDKVFRKVFDLKEIQNSEIARRAGERIRFGSKRVMNIMFIFRDEEVEMRVGGFASNSLS
ncbi:MAG: hypothetical protein KUF80_14675 [Candidatus Thiodiazotropha sp. (ex Codakia orbicularis)]|nr:hypothetical protein [Candidatus Thiodiazotropha sp. (ex Codakia orbicularis)]